jgi:hypothetical protein
MARYRVGVFYTLHACWDAVFPWRLGQEGEPSQDLRARCPLPFGVEY